MADVAMKTYVFMLNAAKVIPRMAPPVPSTPATKPDKIPPPMELRIVGFTSSFLNIRNVMLVQIRNMASAISRISEAMYLLMNAPMMTNITAGIPNESTTFLSNPLWKNAILVMLLETWTMAVIPSTEWKSRK